MDKGKEHEVEFFKSGEDAAESLESPEETLDLVSLLINRLVVKPWVEPVGLWRHNRHPSEVERQLTGLVVFVDSVWRRVSPNFAQNDASIPE